MARNGPRYDPVPPGHGQSQSISEVSPNSRKSVGSGLSPNEKKGVKYQTVSLDTANDTSDVSLMSRKTASSGPSKNEPALITSKWGIGWQMPTLILACYTLGTRNLQKQETISWPRWSSCCYSTCSSDPFQIHQREASWWAKPSGTPIICHHGFKRSSKHFRHCSESLLVSGFCTIPLAPSSSTDDEDFHPWAPIFYQIKPFPDLQDSELGSNANSLSPCNFHVGTAGCDKLPTWCYYCQNCAASILWDVDCPNFECIFCKYWK